MKAVLIPIVKPMFTIPGQISWSAASGAALVLSADAKTHQRIFALMQRV